MFWKKKRKEALTETSVQAVMSKSAVDLCHTKIVNLDLRRSILDWRDNQIERIETQLKIELDVLYRSLDHHVDKMSAQDLFRQNKFSKEKIEPLYQDWATREVSEIVKVAQEELSKVFVRALEYADQSSQLSQAADKGHYTDASVALAATAGGVAVIPTFISMSVVSAGGILGFFGATTIAFPVVAVGVLTVGGLLALGGYKAAALKSKAIRRYRKAIIKTIDSQVMGEKTDIDSTSIRKRLQNYIEETARSIIMEIDK